MDELAELIRSHTGLSPETQGKIVASMIAIGTVAATRIVLLRIVRARDPDLHRQYRWQRVSAYVGAVLVALVIARIWLSLFGGLGTFLGLLSAGIAIALKDPFVNLAGWLFIVVRRPFEIGHRVEVGSTRGDVVDVGLFDFSLMEVGAWASGDDRSGRLLRVPNGKVFTEIVASYQDGWFEHIWDELEVRVSFESNWEAARAILHEIVLRYGERLDKEEERDMRRRASSLLVLDDAQFTPHVYVMIGPHNVELTMRYVVKPRRRRAIKEKMSEAVLEAFAKREDIDFAYPTQRFFNNVFEGKIGTRASFNMGPGPAAATRSAEVDSPPDPIPTSGSRAESTARDG